MAVDSSQSFLPPKQKKWWGSIVAMFHPFQTCIVKTTNITVIQLICVHIIALYCFSTCCRCLIIALIIRIYCRWQLYDTGQFYFEYCAKECKECIGQYSLHFRSYKYIFHWRNKLYPFCPVFFFQLKINRKLFNGWVFGFRID